MGVELSDGFSLRAAVFNFDRDNFETLSAMTNADMNFYPDSFIASCKETHKAYILDKPNKKWNEISGSGSSATVSANTDVVSGEVLSSITIDDKSYLIQDKVGDLSALTTSAQSCAVSAINEVMQIILEDERIHASAMCELNEHIGVMSALTTEEKYSLVDAINELNEKAMASGGTLVSGNTGITEGESLSSITIDKKGYLIQDKVGDLSLLVTSAKSCAVSAINEVVQTVLDDEYVVANAVTKINDNIGDLSALTTEEKSSLVDAINELNEKAMASGGTLVSGNTGITEGETLSSLTIDNVSYLVKEGQIIQVEELKNSATVDDGVIYQYIGDTTSDYTEGYFYKNHNGYKRSDYEEFLTSATTTANANTYWIDDNNKLYDASYKELPITLTSSDWINYTGSDGNIYVKTDGYKEEYVYNIYQGWERINVQPNNIGYTGGTAIHIESGVVDTMISSGFANSVEVSIYDDGLYAKAVQLTNMPDANTVRYGTIYQYVGETNSAFTQGYFYKVDYEKLNGQTIYVRQSKNTDYTVLADIKNTVPDFTQWTIFSYESDRKPTDLKIVKVLGYKRYLLSNGYEMYTDWVYTNVVTQFKYNQIWKQIDVQPSLSGSSSGSSAVTTSAITANVEIGSVTNGTKYEIGTPLEIIIRDMLFKYKNPSITLSISPSTVSKFDSVSSMTVTTSVTKGTSDIDTIKTSAGTISIKEQTSGGAFTYKPATPITSNTTFKAVVTDTEGKSASTTATLTFIVPFYYGALASTTLSALTDLTEVVKSKQTLQCTFNCDEKYLYFAYDKSYGKLTSIYNNNGEMIQEFNDPVESTFNDTTFYVYRTKALQTVDLYLNFKF